MVATAGGVLLAVALTGAPASVGAAAAARPTVDSVSAASGPTVGGNTVTVRGSHFSRVQAVSFSGVLGRHIDVVSSSKLTVTAPRHLAGQVQVRVQTADGASSVRAADRYDYQLYASVAAGGYHSCSLLDGHVQCWGYNGDGQLGNGTEVDAHTPVAVSGLSHVVAISAGEYFTCALKSDGTVWCWGYDESGQLGDGVTGTNSDVPGRVIKLGHAVAIAVGYFQACAVLADGTARCWGGNGEGELGDNTTTDTNRPAVVQGLTHTVSITANYYFTCAQRSDGTAWCWGDNESGQLGDDSITTSFVPVQVHGLTRVTSLSAGYYAACAVAAGLVKCWGYNAQGELGRGNTTSSETPVTVSGLSGASAVSAGGDFGCALVRGSPFCWGEREYAEIGDGGPETTSYNQLTPAAIIGLRGVTDLSSGGYQSCTLRSGNRLNCWGYNDYGELGNNTTTDSTSPEAVG